MSNAFEKAVKLEETHHGTCKSICNVFYFYENDHF